MHQEWIQERCKLTTEIVVKLYTNWKTTKYPEMYSIFKNLKIEYGGDLAATSVTPLISRLDLADLAG